MTTQQITVNELRRALGMRKETGTAQALAGWSYCGQPIKTISIARYGVIRYYLSDDQMAVFSDSAYLDD